MKEEKEKSCMVNLYIRKLESRNIRGLQDNRYEVLNSIFFYTTNRNLY